MKRLVEKCIKCHEGLAIHPHYPLMKNMAFFTLASLLGNFFAFLFHFYVARALTALEYGTLSALIAAYGMFLLLVGSFSTLVTKKVAQEKQNVPAIARYALKLALAFSLAVGIPLMLFSQAFGDYFHIKDAWLAPVFAVAVGFGCVWAALNGVIQGLERFFLSGLAAVAGSLAKLVLGGLAVGLLGYGLFGAFGAFGANAMVCALIAIWSIGQMPRTDGEGHGFGRIRDDFFNILMIDAGLFFAMNIDLIVMGNLFYEDNLGFYSAASMVAKIISYALLPLAVVAFPRMAGGRERLGKPRDVLFFTLAAVAVCGACFLVAYQIAGGFVLSVLYSDKYLQGLQYLMVLSLSVVLYCFNSLISRYFIASHAGTYPKVALLIPIVGAAGFYLAPSIALAPFVMLGINAALLAAGLVLLKYENLPRMRDLEQSENDRATSGAGSATDGRVPPFGLKPATSPEGNGRP
ncbi:MAG: oligosaccharide flippase family protein [Pseudomonadota bacterium]